MNMKNLFAILSLAILLTSCITEDVPDNTPKGNFEALWNIIDTQYCFLDYKHEVFQ